jgi:F-type H+-transporting ATPase subunit b
VKIFLRILPLLLLCASFSLHAQQTAEPATHPAAATSRETGMTEVDETAEYKQSTVVKKLGSMMGMQPAAAATLFEWANFAILALAILYALAKALPKTFRDRTSGIQKSLTDARSATEAASQRLSSVEERLARLDGQIAEMRQQAEKDTAADEIRIKASVEEESKKILAAADQEIAAATQNAQRQLQQYAAELAIEQAARKLVISAETDRLLIQGFVGRLGANEKKGEN